jgi:hypothetical protein
VTPSIGGTLYAIAARVLLGLEHENRHADTVIGSSRYPESLLWFRGRGAMVGRAARQKRCPVWRRGARVVGAVPPGATGAGTAKGNSMAQGGSGLATQMSSQGSSNGASTEERLHGLETAQAVQAATVAGIEATQAAATAGAEATQTAAQAGNMATTAAMQAGNMATMLAGSAGFVVGIFLGLAIANTRRT